MLRVAVDGANDIFEVRRPPTGMVGPRAILTPFGWTLVGRVPSMAPSFEGYAGHVSHVHTDRELHNKVDRFVSIESFGLNFSATLPLSEYNNQAMSILKSTTKLVDYRYECGLLFKCPDPCLPDNRSVVLRRLYSSEREFKRDPEYAKLYATVIDEYLDLGFARQVHNSEDGTVSGRSWFIPHHGVVSVNKPGRVRVVFDASAQYHGTSLNNILLTGPNLLQGLDSKLLLFRKGLVGIASDIEKMYHQVSMPPQEQSFLQFLWRPPGSIEDPKVYKMLVHVFWCEKFPNDMYLRFETYRR